MKRLVVGALLAPTAAWAVYAAALAAAAAAQGWRGSLAFWGGLAAYPLLHLLWARSSRAYVFGHELSHAFAAVLSGSRVRRFVAGKDSGHVIVDRSNVFIALAPYAFPLYTVLVLAAYRLASLRWPGPGPHAVFLAAMGASLGFHWVQTLDILAGETQADLKQAGGRLFSWTLIALVNALIAAALFKLLFPASVSLRGFGAVVWRGTALFWRWAFAQGAALARAGAAWLGRRAAAKPLPSN